MKKNIYSLSLIAFCISLLAVSCQKEMADPGSTEEKNTSEPCLRTITCSFPTMMDENGTKVSLATDGTTGWQVDDEIIIYGQRGTVKGDASTKLDPVRYQLKAADIVDPTTAVFTVDMSSIIDYPDPDTDASRPFNAAVGDDWDFYSDWYSSGRARFGNTNQLLMAGYINSSGVMTLNNLCAAITFTVSGDFDTYYFSGYNGTETVGYEDYLVKMNASTPVYLDKLNENYGTNGAMTTISGPVNGNGTAINYIFIPNEANLPNGFTIVFAKNGVKTKMISSTKALTLSHGHMVNLGLLPAAKIKDFELISAAEKATATDLSNDATYHRSANCYVVSAEGTTNDNKVFKFRTVKGNSFVNGSSEGTSVGSVASAELLWETWNNNSAVTAKSIIKDVEYKDGFVYFKTADPLHEGNAVIAVKDSEDTILWSWHIWVPLTNYTYNTYSGASSVNMMSRNLGALIDAGDGSVTAHGLHYQWGRKDPFVGQGAHGSSDFAKVAGVAKTNRTTTFSSETELNANPTAFVYYSSGKQWYASDNTSFWGSSKTIYDPCPPGWKVPDKSTATTILFEGDLTTPGWTYNATAGNYVVTIGTASFPISSSIYYNGNMTGRENEIRIWSSSSRISSSGAHLGYWLYVAWDADNDTDEEDPDYKKRGKYSQSSEKQAYGCNVRCVAE